MFGILLIDFAIRVEEHAALGIKEKGAAWTSKETEAAGFTDDYLTDYLTEEFGKSNWDLSGKPLPEVKQLYIRAKEYLRRKKEKREKEHPKG